MWTFTLSEPSINAGTPATIETPKSFEDATFKLERSQKYLGVFRQWSVPLIFKGDGYKFIRKVYDTVGVDAEITVKITYDCGGTVELMTGKIMLHAVKFLNELGTCLAEAPIEPNGAQQMLLQRANEKVNLFSKKRLSGDSDVNLLGTLPHTMQLHSKVLRKVIYAEIEPYTQFTTDTYLHTDDCFSFPISYIKTLLYDYSFRFLPIVGTGTGLVSSTDNMQLDVGLLNPIVQEIDVFNQPTYTDYPNTTTTHDLLTASESGTYTLNISNYQYSGTIGVINYPGACGENEAEELRVKLHLKMGSFTTVIANTVNATGCLGWINFNDTINFSTTQTLNAGDTIQLYFEILWRESMDKCILNDRPGVHFILFQAEEKGCFSLIADTVTPSTQVRGCLVNEAFARVVDSLTDGRLSFRSNYFGRKGSLPEPSPNLLNGCASYLAITNGKLLRKLDYLTDEPDANVCNFPIPLPPSQSTEEVNIPLLTSWDDLFNAMNAVWACGMDFEIGAVRVEEKTYFFDSVSAPILTFQYIPESKTYPFNDLIFNRVLAGYETWKPDQINGGIQRNGLDEFNSTREYSTGIRFKKSDYDARCKFIASGSLLESQRRMDSDNNTNGAQDDSNFLVCLKRGNDSSGYANEINQSEQDENFTYLNASGNLLDASTDYNLRIAPQRNIQRHFPFLFAFAQKLKQTFSEGNDNEALRANDESVCCPENVPSLYPDLWNYSDLNACNQPIFRPEILEFEYPLKLKDFLKIKQYPYRKIRVASPTDKSASTDFKDYFLWSVDYKPMDGMAVFKLLRAI